MRRTLKNSTVEKSTQPMLLFWKLMISSTLMSLMRLLAHYLLDSSKRIKILMQLNLVGAESEVCDRIVCDNVPENGRPCCSNQSNCSSILRRRRRGKRSQGTAPYGDGIVSVFVFFSPPCFPYFHTKVGRIRRLPPGTIKKSLEKFTAARKTISLSLKAIRHL